MAHTFPSNTSVQALTEPDVQMSDPRVALDLGEEEASMVLEELRRTLARHTLGQLDACEALAEALAWFTVEGA